MGPPPSPESPDSLLFSGHALLPKDTAVYETAKRITCVIEVDAASGRIIDAAFTTLTPLLGRFLRDILVGHDLNQGTDPVVQAIRRRCHLTGLGAFIKAIEIACRKWEGRGSR